MVPGEDGYPTPYELGEMFGSIQTRLDGIDARLKKGDTTMEDLNNCVKDQLEDSKESVNNLEKKIIAAQSSADTGINKVNARLDLHGEKTHLYHVTEDEGRMTRVMRHLPEMGGGAVGGGAIFLLILKLIEHYA